MDKLSEYSHQLFDLVKIAGLLPSATIADVFPENTLKEALNLFEKDKSVFLKSATDLKNPSQIWDENIDQKYKDKALEILMSYLVDHRQAFYVGWDQPLEDIIFNFETVCPDLNIIYLGEFQKDGKWCTGMQIADKTFEYTFEDINLYDIIDIFNHFLLGHNKVILYADTLDCNDFVVIDTMQEDAFLASGFRKP